MVFGSTQMMSNTTTDIKQTSSAYGLPFLKCNKFVMDLQLCLVIEVKLLIGILLFIFQNLFHFLVKHTAVAA